MSVDPRTEAGSSPVGPLPLSTDDARVLGAASAVRSGSGPSVRAIAKVFFTVVGLAATLFVAYLVRSVLGLVLISVFLAVAFGPAVDLFSRRIPRAAAILVTYLLLFLVVVGVGTLVVPPVVSQVEGLATKAPQYLSTLRANENFKHYDNRYDITGKLETQVRQLPSRLASAAGALQSVTVGVFSAVVQLVTVLTITFFLLLDGARIVEFLFGLTGPLREPRALRLAGEIYSAVAGYVSGNLVISAIAGLVTYVTLLILGVPFSVPLAVLMAFLDLIPLVGASIGGIAILIVTLFTAFPTGPIVWAVVFIVYQQVENNVLQPIVYRRTVNVAPLVVIVAILIGSSLLGVLGALVAIPVAASIQIVAKDVWRQRPSRVALPDALRDDSAATTSGGIVLP